MKWDKVHTRLESVWMNMDSRTNNHEAVEWEAYQEVVYGIYYPVEDIVMEGVSDSIRDIYKLNHGDVG